MRVTSLELTNFRSFASLPVIELDQINVLIGPNNSGKSSILKALHLMQEGCADVYPDVRVNNENATVKIGLDGMQSEYSGDGAATLIIEINSNRVTGAISHELYYGGQQVLNPAATMATVKPLKNIEQQHFVVPFFSKRKTAYYQEDVKSENALRISNDWGHLAAKLSRVASPSFPTYEKYSSTCKTILGFVVSATPSQNGQRPGIFLGDRKILTIDQMGDGVPHIVALLADLAQCEGKLFLIEEPENDLHPQALKALLDLILESSASNQFVITTHSNIVVRHLASAEKSKLYSINTELGILPPTASIRLVPQTVEARLEVLRELGYALSDFELWDGWLILEESSAERIIRDYLIPWFAPKLSRVRTLAANGITNVEPIFNDFDRLVRFTHLEVAYRDAAWVRVDGDEPGNIVIQKLREKYKSWNLDRFSCFTSKQFEHYYPTEFAEKIKSTLATTGKSELRAAKKKLLDEVIVWLDENESRGRQSLQKSADEIIKDLQSIERQLLSR